MKKQKEVLIIFKTHLDVGFTDYSKNIVDKYLNVYIPNAIKVGNELKDSDTPFSWTVGSWLIWLALKHDKSGEVAKAVKDGILRWHALPFTTHTELMSAKLFDYGLSISSLLDERFGVRTRAAKMSDVPGHTIGMVPLMVKRGVRFLHLGVNPATPLPPVPPIFKWKNGDSQITVMYQGDYGEVAEFDDFIIYFAHTGDNLGPQSAQDIIEVYENIRKKYPDCVLKSASIDDIADRVEKLQNLPVIEKEIGDTWIHGAGTDPQKVSRYRSLLRYLNGLDNIPVDLTESLLCVPEHTWGMDVKKYFANDKAYYHGDMEKLESERSVIEKSWQEQRGYVEAAEKALGVKPDYPAQKPDLSIYSKVALPKELPFEISWQIFDNSDYERYKKVYMRCFEDWAIWDFTKINLPNYVGGCYAAKPVKAYECGAKKLFLLEFESDAAQKFGLPYFYVEIEGEKLTFKWFNKKICRLPQACWLKFKGLNEKWQIQKTGRWISPEDILGSPLISAIDEGVKNDDVFIRSLDCALVAPFGKKLLQYNCEPRGEDLHFNLYNNVWNTNFPMWYSDDAVFRFTVEKREEKTFKIYQEWLNEAADSDVKNELLRVKDNPKEIEDRFYRSLEFGTGGLRGIIGAGTNRMNIYTVGRATSGLAEYIIKNGITPSVAIAYDSRNKSREFAFRAAEILSSKGITACIFNEITPTPVLSYAVRKLGAGAGIVITASHNPKEYNGYKVYNEKGCQITSVAAASILAEIERADYFADFVADNDKIQILGGEILSDFITEIEKFSLSDFSLEDKLKVVYTPLHGTGNIPVRTVLERMGAEVFVVKEQELPDGEFTTCPYPNPEERAALSLALDYARKLDADLVLATDPDADRIGIAVRDGGDYALLNGNETGVLMANYMLSLKKQKGELGDNPALIKTIVTSDMVFDVAKAYGASVKEVLTGFKYIGEELDKTKNYVMGLEESYGYLVGDHVRDKDAVSAAMIIAEACAYYKKRGKTLLEVLSDLYAKFGYYLTELKSLKYEGIDGMAAMAAVIDKVRSNPVTQFAGLPLKFTDFAKGAEGLPKSNVLRFASANARLIIRPSGTEPKLKIYYQVKGETYASAKSLLNGLIDLSNEILKG